MQDSKIAENNGKLANAAKTAKHGYNALVSGDDKVVSGCKNRMQVTMANAKPDSVVADNVNKMQEPVSEQN